MKEKITRWLQAYGRLLTGLAILLCVAGLAVSYMKPKQKLETVAINMGTEHPLCLRHERISHGGHPGGCDEERVYFYGYAADLQRL